MLQLRPCITAAPLGLPPSRPSSFRPWPCRPIPPGSCAAACSAPFPANRRWALRTDALNSDRFPDYQSLDLRLERRLGYGWLRMMFYLDFQNVLARENVFTYVYNDRNGQRVTVKQLPFFPMGDSSWGSETRITMDSIRRMAWEGRPDDFDAGYLSDGCASSA